MPVIKLETEINAPAERVFDLARCIDLHAESMGKSNEKAVAGVTTGLIHLGETVTWEAIHLGIRQNLTTEITQYDYPRHFRDSMVSGAFARFDHDHFFAKTPEGTIMRDVFDYTSPLGILGRTADLLFLENYMKSLLQDRNMMIKQVAEGQDWKKFIPAEKPSI